MQKYAAIKTQSLRHSCVLSISKLMPVACYDSRFFSRMASLFDSSKVPKVGSSNALDSRQQKLCFFLTAMANKDLRQ